MRGTLSMDNKPVAELDEVQLVQYNDNHTRSPQRVFYKTGALNKGKTMIELHRDQHMVLTLEDGRQGNVVLQHANMDMQGNSVGVLRVVGQI